ncbi:glycosyltransferase family 2 protein [Riemerella columbipharyngis]|uniref:Glycosyltransferase, GT2 family n=1 Tax=Riemerella columbipharyngis TaxID=1071918 RepID=A0A1G7AV84_9FLAO|nr:glycosyltransferase family 2 protein [Riemerella columbipharyngis]SDE18610.1 Glycosyltransferase, GT2 family [Riemerella columbipharyngis]
MKLSIIIVNYNVTALLRACLKSIEKFINGIEYEVIVADNHSSDQSWKNLINEFPKVQFIGFSSNLGFSKANNKAVSHAKGEYLLLLNPDTEFEQEGMSEIIKFADQCQNFGCLGVRMHNAKGSFLPESKRSVPNVINSFEKIFSPFSSNHSQRKNYYRNDIKENTIAPVEVITGAFMLIKNKTYQEIGGLDERYFMYGEDIDICYTLLRMGFENYYYGAFSILHHKGQSTKKDHTYLNNFYGAMELFIEKYYKEQSPRKFKILQKGLKLKYHIEKLMFNYKN